MPNPAIFHILQVILLSGMFISSGIQTPISSICFCINYCFPIFPRKPLHALGRYTQLDYEWSQGNKADSSIENLSRMWRTETNKSLQPCFKKHHPILLQLQWNLYSFWYFMDYFISIRMIFILKDFLVSFLRLMIWFSFRFFFNYI